MPAASPSTVVTWPAVGLEGEVRAGVHRPAVDEDHAGAALGIVAALLGAGQPELAAQHGQQRPAGLDLHAGSCVSFTWSVAG